MPNSHELPDLPRFEPRRDARPDDLAWPELVWPPPREELRGRFVSLSPVDLERDASELFEALDHDEVWAHVPQRPTDPTNYAEILRGRDPKAGWFVWVLRATQAMPGVVAGSIIGTSSFLNASPHDASLEIGATAYAPSVWATAVNPEAKLLLLSHAFDELHAGRVQIKTDIRNHRSQQAIARLGATYEGTLRRHFRREDGTVRDTVMFSVIAEEWPAVRERLTARVQAFDDAAGGPWVLEAPDRGGFA